MSHQHGTVSSRSPSEVILQSIQDRFEIVFAKYKPCRRRRGFLRRLCRIYGKRDVPATVVAGGFERSMLSLESKGLPLDTLHGARRARARHGPLFEILMSFKDNL